MADYLPNRTVLLEEFKTRVTPGAWELLSEGERGAIAMLIYGRCRKAVEAAFAEFAEIAMRARPTEKSKDEQA